MAEEQILQARIQHLYDTEANWKTIEESFVPKSGEIIIYAVDDTHSQPRMKVGSNGKTLKELLFCHEGVAVDNTLANSGQAADASVVGEALDEIKTRLEELEYVPITISSFTNTTGTVEMGTKLTSVTLNWTTSKTPTTLTLDGTTIEKTLTSHTYTYSAESPLTATKKYKLVVTDNKGATDNKETSVYFYNRVCYGVAAQPDEVNSDFVNSLATKKLAGSRTNSKVAYNAGNGQYLWYCVPTRLGACSFTDIETGLGAGLSLVATIDVTNASNYTEKYYVYRSDYAGLGSINVKVS